MEDNYSFVVRDNCGLKIVVDCCFCFVVVFEVVAVAVVVVGDKVVNVMKILIQHDVDAALLGR